MTQDKVKVGVVIIGNLTFEYIAGWGSDTGQDVSAISIVVSGAAVFQFVYGWIRRKGRRESEGVFVCRQMRKRGSLV